MFAFIHPYENREVTGLASGRARFKSTYIWPNAVVLLISSGKAMAKATTSRGRRISVETEADMEYSQVMKSAAYKRLGSSLGVWWWRNFEEALGRMKP